MLTGQNYLKTIGFFSVMFMLTACTSKHFDVADPDGTLMFSGHQKGFCVVGCGLGFNRADGVKCSGFAPGLEQGRPLASSISCPNEPKQHLTIEKLSFDHVNIGRLEGLAIVEARNRARLDALIDTLN